MTVRAIIGALAALSLCAFTFIGGDTNQLGGLGHAATSFTAATCSPLDTNLTTYDHQAITTNASDGDAVYIVVGFVGEDALTTFGVNSATVTAGGQVHTMTQIVDEDGTGIVNTAIFATTYPIQDASVVSVQPTYSEAITSSTACVWAFRGINSVTPTSSVADDDTAGGAIVLTTGTTTTGGFVVCVSGDSTITETVSWAVVSEITDGETAEHSYSNASLAATGASMANTATWSSTSDASGSCVAVR
jgi:hypothetical protein